jgi:hypothetical protein
VLKPGGIVAVAFVTAPNSADFVGSPLRGQLSELFDYFTPDLDYVFWQEESPGKRSAEVRCSAIFRLK